MSSGCVSIRNFTIRFMPIPIIDASQALKASPEKTEDALLKVYQQFPPPLSICYCIYVVYVKQSSNSGYNYNSNLIHLLTTVYIVIVLVYYYDSGFEFSHQIENYLYRNHETRKYLQEQAYRLQQGIVTTTTQQVCT